MPLTHAVRIGRPPKSAGIEPSGRFCDSCGAQLVRKRDPIERSRKWQNRRFCNVQCAVDGRSAKPAKAQYDSIDWAPIVFSPDETTTDRCWAGFVAGCRCVLPRGDHTMHRDSTGREFLRAERRSMESIERNTGTNPLLEIVNLRNSWRSRTQ